jgi:mannose-6-phosphate isomerase class I
VPSKPHDLFLIPNGTVHCSGANNLVLEISATPYIFTFKIYDYLRRDLEGNLRPINIHRAWENIRFERRSEWVAEHLIPVPRIINEGPRWREYLLSDRKEFFYDVLRVDFEDSFPYDTRGRALAMNLVEGEAVEILSENGRVSPLRYLESIVVPAAAGRFTVRNCRETPARMVIVYVRPGTGRFLPMNDPIE